MKQSSIVLLHGSAAGAHGWKAVHQALSAALPKARLIVPDMLGYGAAPPPSARYTFAEEVAYLTDFINRHGADDFHLVTHSFGTAYGLHLRLANLHRVTRLTLVDPLVRNILVECHEVAGYTEMEGPYQEFINAWPDGHAAIRAFVDHWNGAGTWDAMGDGTRNWLAGMATKVHLELTRGWADTTTLATFTTDPPPTAILVGETTRLAPRATARLLAAKMNADISIVRGAGHMIPNTHPQAVVQAILKQEKKAALA